MQLIYFNLTTDCLDCILKSSKITTPSQVAIEMDTRDRTDIWRAMQVYGIYIEIRYKDTQDIL